MSEIKQVNNQPSKYQELNDFELEIVCGGNVDYYDGRIVNGKDYVPETVASTKTEAA